MTSVKAASRSLFVVFFFVCRIRWLLSTWMSSDSSADGSGCSCDLRYCSLFSVGFLARFFRGAASSIENGVVLGSRSGVEIAIGAPPTHSPYYELCMNVYSNDRLSQV